MTHRIEICANSVQSALMAQEGGAYRVELCAGIPEGGTTPSHGEISVAATLLSATLLNVIIRPRGGDFHYDEIEQDIMLADIEFCKKVGVNGVVFGCLTSEGNVDLTVMQRLMKAAEGMEVTFHRAFDMCRNPHEALEEIISLGCHRVLTSGQSSNALEGAELIATLVKQAGGRIIIMPGCGVRPDNIRSIADITGAEEFHLSARASLESKMKYRNPYVSMGGTFTLDEYIIQQTDPAIVAAAIAALSD